MTAKQLGNQAAFTNDGMTLRQHYVGLAMNGLIKIPHWTEIIEQFGEVSFFHDVASKSVYLADALLTELAKTDA